MTDTQKQILLCCKLVGILGMEFGMTLLSGAQVLKCFEYLIVYSVVLCICEVRIIALLVGLEVICLSENTASSSYQELPLAMDTVLVFSFSSEGSRWQTLRLWEL